MKRFILILALAMASAVGASAQVANSELVEGMKYKELKHMYDYKAYAQTLDDRYGPAGLGVASFFIPGLGQMLTREIGRGFAWFGGAAASYVVAVTGSACSIVGMEQGDQTLVNAGTIVSFLGLASLLTVEIWSIVDAVRVAKVKNMYEQDLKKKYSLDVDLYPSVNYVQTSGGVKPTAGLSLALKF